MGLKKHKGILRPDGIDPARWVKMSHEERSKVYKTTKEALAGSLKNVSRNALAKKLHDSIASPKLNYNLKKKATHLGKFPLSRAIHDAVKQQGELGGHKPREVMFFALDYLQNAAENKATMTNIDLVKKSDTVEIYCDGG